MKYLLDAHSLIWAQDSPEQLGAAAIVTLEDRANELLLSAATVWELSIKSGLKKLILSQIFRDWIEAAIVKLDLHILPITVRHADFQAGLPWHHKDPFDRLIAAQALVEAVPIISADMIFDQYQVMRIWE